MRATIDMNYVVDVFYFNMLRYNRKVVIISSPDSRIQSCHLEFWIVSSKCCEEDQSNALWYLGSVLKVKTAHFTVFLN